MSPNDGRTVRERASRVSAGHLARSVRHPSSKEPSGRDDRGQTLARAREPSRGRPRGVGLEPMTTRRTRRGSGGRRRPSAFGIRDRYVCTALFAGALDGGPDRDGLVYFDQTSNDRYLERHGYGVVAESSDGTSLTDGPGRSDIETDCRPVVPCASFPPESSARGGPHVQPVALDNGSARGDREMARSCSRLPGSFSRSVDDR